MSALPNDLSQLTLVVDGTTAVVPCMSFTLFVEGPKASGVLDFYERSRAALGNRLTHYVAESMKRRAKVTERAETMVPTWAKSPREGKSYFIRFSGCDEAGGVTAQGLEISFRVQPPLTPERVERMRSNWRTLSARGVDLALPVSSLHVTLPLDHALAKEPARFADWVMGFSLVRDGSFLSGGVSYSLAHHDVAGSTEVRALMDRRIASLCSRYPGFEWHGTSTAAHILRWDGAADEIVMQVKRVSWLTLLGESIVRQLGGLEALTATFSATAAIRVRPASTGAVIQAGDAPMVGDLGRRDLSPLYRRVAAVIRPARARALPGPSGIEEEWVNDWLRAFDEAPS